MELIVPKKAIKNNNRFILIYIKRRKITKYKGKSGNTAT